MVRLYNPLTLQVRERAGDGVNLPVRSEEMRPPRGRLLKNFGLRISNVEGKIVADNKEAAEVVRPIGPRDHDLDGAVTLGRLFDLYDVVDSREPMVKLYDLLPRQVR